jgi:transcriptional regulator with XRE-family HTH domain
MFLTLSGDSVKPTTGATTATAVENEGNMAVWQSPGRGAAVGASMGSAGTGFATMTGPTVGEVVRRYRRLRRLTQQELGEAIGSDKSYIGKLETSDQEPSLELLRRLAKALGVPASILTTPLGYVPLDEAAPKDALEAAVAAITELDIPDDEKQAIITLLRARVTVT